MGRWVFEQRHVAKGTSWAHRWHTLCLNHFRQGIAGAVRAAGAPPTSLSVVFCGLLGELDICTPAWWSWCMFCEYVYIISGWWFQSLWKTWKSVGMIIPNIWKNKKCSKPPTRYIYNIVVYCAVYSHTITYHISGGKSAPLSSTKWSWPLCDANIRPEPLPTM